VTRRRQLGLGLLAFGVSALALVFSASPVHAEAPSKTGWWFELQTKTLPAPLPSPPVVPDGGLYVQQGPQGPTAYGAVHYDAKSAMSATLTLVIAPGSTPAQLGTPVQACATSGSWDAPNPSPGPWESAPKYGQPCTPGKIAADGSAVAFFFDSSFVKSDALDLAIAPADGSRPFSLVFNKPADQSLSLTSKPGSLPSSGGSTSATHATGATGSASAASHLSTAAPVAKPATPAAPTTPAAPAAATTPSSVANSVLNVAGLGDPDRGERAVALAGASALVIGWWLLSTRALPMPRLLGALASGGGSPSGAADP
jgi:hypothetical protein